MPISAPFDAARFLANASPIYGAQLAALSKYALRDIRRITIVAVSPDASHGFAVVLRGQSRQPFVVYDSRGKDVKLWTELKSAVRWINVHFPSVRTIVLHFPS